jgi:hypothetical protein
MSDSNHQLQSIEDDEHSKYFDVRSLECIFKLNENTIKELN